MSDQKPDPVDPVTGENTTGHSWDGITELDTPLPRWWLYLFYATIAVSVVYMVLMPALPGLPGMPANADHTGGVLGHSDRAIVAQDVNALRTARAAGFADLHTLSYAEIEANPQALSFMRAAGEAVFGDNCATCHGAGGRGQTGYPSLTDNAWIWGGTLDDIVHTLNVGIRSDHAETRFSQMPAYGRDGLLSAQEIDDVTEYVLTLSQAQTGETVDAAAAARGAAVFEQQCQTCHMADGSGDQAQGAPSLRDNIWLYAGGREGVRDQIWTGRGGVMPSWSGRLDDDTIRAVAIYVYALGGGVPDAPPTPPPAEPEAAVEEGAAAAESP